MPTLSDNRPTKKITIPSIEGSELVIFPSLLLKDINLADLQAVATPDGMIKQLPQLIKSWNLTDPATGDVLPITVDNLGLLAMDDVTHILTELSAFQEEVKKK